MADPVPNARPDSDPTAAAGAATSSILAPTAGVNGGLPGLPTTPGATPAPTASNQNGEGAGGNLVASTATNAAAVNSLSSPPSPSSSSQANSKTNVGAIAGAAVGAAVGAAILTFLLTFMIFRKRSQKKQSHRRRSHDADGGPYSEKALPNAPNGSDSPSGILVPAPAYHKHLPQSADDTTIRTSIRTLFDQLELHVENFYHDVAASVPLTEELQAALQRIDSPHLPDSIISLLPRARSQLPLIKHCLVSYLVASISTDDGSVPSLLPTDFATLPLLAEGTGQKKAGE
jgi:hypothetical protein